MCVCVCDVALLIPTFLRLRLLLFCPSLVRSFLFSLQRALLPRVHACVTIKPVLGRCGPLLIPVPVQGVSFLAGEEVVSLVLQRLRRTPDHRPQRGRCDLGCDRQLDRRGVHLLSILAVVTVAGGWLGGESDQEEGYEAAGGSQSCNRRDEPEREVEKRNEVGGVTDKLGGKMLSTGTAAQPRQFEHRLPGQPSLRMTFQASALHTSLRH